MTNKTFRKALLGIALLASLSAGAQGLDSELQLSNDEVTYWYRICSALPGMEDYAMTDYNGMTYDMMLILSVYLLPTENTETASQWKLTAGEEGRIILTNRATGHQIDSKSSSQNSTNYNFTLMDCYKGTTPGFTITSLGNDAFKLESVEDDGVNRCLAFAERHGEALTYPESNESTSAIGWKFFPVEIEDAIGSMKGSSTIIRVNGKRISVSGCRDWQLFNTSGEEMPRTVALPTGVYMVKMPQKTVKIAIQ